MSLPVVPSEFRALHVIFVNRALSEVSQAKLNRLRNVQAGQLQAVAVRIGIIQNRAGFFSFAPIRCPCSEARHARKSCAFLGKLRSRCLLKILLPDAAMYSFSSKRCRGFGATPVLVASSFRNVQRVGKHSTLYSNTPAIFVEEHWLFQRIRHFLVLIV